jgi:hypothetical protein
LQHWLALSSNQRVVNPDSGFLGEKPLGFVFKRKFFLVAKFSVHFSHEGLTTNLRGSLKPLILLFKTSNSSLFSFRKPFSLHWIRINPPNQVSVIFIDNYRYEMKPKVQQISYIEFLPSSILANLS